MKVIIDALSARQGGSQTHLRNLLSHDVPIAGGRAWVVVPSNLELPRLGLGVERIDVPAACSKPLIRAGLAPLLLGRLGRKLEPDVLFCLPTLPPVVRPASRSVVQIQSLLPFDREEASRYGLSYTRFRLALLARVILRTVRRADLVITVSEHARRVIADRADGRGAPIVVIPPGVNEEFFLGSQQTPPPSLPGSGYLLYVSDIEPYKHQIQVVQAFAKVKERWPGKEKLVLVGSPGARRYLEDLRAEIDRLGLRDEVCLTGRVPFDSLPAVYAGARVIVFASACEACPTILLEAMASGRALAVSDRPPMPDVAGDAAVYFDPKQPDQIADRVLELLANEERSDELGRRAVARARGFDPDESARSTWEAIAGLLTGTNQQRNGGTAQDWQS